MERSSNHSFNGLDRIQTPLISVIVPFFNAEDTLERCVNSILTQSLTDFELLLVDDGSIDESQRICDRFAKKDSRVKVWHKDHSGVSSTRNFGLDKAVGEYICFADADDYVTDIWLDSLFHSISEHPDSLVVQNVLIEEPSRVYLRYSDLDGLYPIDVIWKLGSWGYSWNKIFRKDIIEEHGLRFDESLSVFEDELFVARYSSDFDTAFVIPSVGYHYLNTVLLADRYKDQLNLDTVKYLYEKVKLYNHNCSLYMVDRVVMSSFQEMKKQNDISPIVSYLREKVSEDIRYVCGRKKLLLKMLHKTKAMCIWRLVFLFYLRFTLVSTKKS